MTVDEKIVRVLETATQPLGPKEIALRADEDHGYVRKRVRALDNEGKIEGLSGGKYRSRRQSNHAATVTILTEGLYPKKARGSEESSNGKAQRRGERKEDETIFVHREVEVDWRFLKGLVAWHEKPTAGTGESMSSGLSGRGTRWIAARVRGNSGEPMIRSGTWVLGTMRSVVRAEGYHLLYKRTRSSRHTPTEDSREFKASYLYPWKGDESKGFIEETGAGRDNRTWVHGGGSTYTLMEAPGDNQDTRLIGVIVGALINPNAFPRKEGRGSEGKPAERT